jgi:hypothetical protein
MSPSPQTIQKSTTVSPHISDGDVSSTHPVRMHGRKTHEPYEQKTLILGAAVPGEASETMVELCLWPSIILVRKLAIYCNYLVHSTSNRFLCTRVGTFLRNEVFKRFMLGTRKGFHMAIHST